MMSPVSLTDLGLVARPLSRKVAAAQFKTFLAGPDRLGILDTQSRALVCNLKHIYLCKPRFLLVYPKTPPYIVDQVV